MSEYFTYELDVFRIYPFRFIGYAATMYDLLWRNDSDRDNHDKDRWPLIITTNYVCLHAVYRTVGSLVSMNHTGEMCAGPRNAFQLPPLALGESLLWDISATVIMPYTVAFLVYRLIRDLACGSLDPGNPVRKYTPICVSVASVFLLSPVVDNFCLELCATAINMINPC